MASIFGATPFRRVIPSVLKAVKSGTSIEVRRHLLTSRSGAIAPEPQKVPFPLLKVILVLTPGIYIGAAIAKNGANILEENEIFVPQEDDDED